MVNIPGYSVSGEIGRGGMAVVYRARQVLLDCLLRSQPEVMTLENLGQLLQIPVNTLRADLHRRPETMPRRLYLPGRRLVRFLRVDVAVWLLSSRSNDGVIVDAANRVASRGTL